MKESPEWESAARKRPNHFCRILTEEWFAVVRSVNISVCKKDSEFVIYEKSLLFMQCFVLGIQTLPSSLRMNWHGTVLILIHHSATIITEWRCSGCKIFRLIWSSFNSRHIQKVIMKHSPQTALRQRLSLWNKMLAQPTLWQINARRMGLNNLYLSTEWLNTA